MKRLVLIVVGVLASVLLSGQQVRAYSFSAWGSMTGAKTLAVNPFFYGGIGPFESTLDLVLGYGVSEKFDVYANLAGIFFDGYGSTSYSGSWLMPRVDLGGNNILALQVGGFGDDGFALGPQYHFFWENDRIALEFNAALAVTVSAPEESTASLFLAPVFKVADGTFHVFCEMDPAYTASGSEKGFDLGIMPGIWLGFGPDALHQLSLGVSMNDWWNSGKLDGVVSWGFNLWYWTTFEFGTGGGTP